MATKNKQICLEIHINMLEKSIWYFSVEHDDDIWATHQVLNIQK